MDSTNGIYGLLILLLTCLSTGLSSGPQEYCIRDTFQAKCQPTEIIQITKAVYGRMKIGKCVKTDLGFLGCQAEVLNIVSRSCSGRMECDYPVFNDPLMATKPCGDELQSYLEVDYHCIPVLNRPVSECKAGAIPISENQGYMSSYVARESGCGSMAHPWRIEVQPGQRVNFTLHSSRQDKATRKCKSLGHIVEQGHRNNVTICSKVGGEEHIYTSNGRPLHVHLNTVLTSETNPDFILHYKVIGCADIKVPMFAWYKREGDAATIGCENQDLMWTLKCEGSRWSGVVGNCTDNVAASKQQPSNWMNTEIDPKKLTILCIVVGFVILIVIAGIVIVWKWRESSQHKPPSTILLQEEQYRLNKGPLPPVPENSSHYRSLIRQPDPQAFPLHSQTMPRPPPQQDMQEGDDYSADWRFGTAPWQKQGTQAHG